MSYWAMRTWRDYPDLIMSELRAGRLRQGWGGDPDQDLRKVAQIWTPEGGDWDALSSAQQQTWRHFAMLGMGDWSMQVGDVVLLPNLPDPGTFSLCRISGAYSFEPIRIEAGFYDCGHIRAAQLIPGCEAIKNDNAAVAPGIQRTLRCQSRLWRIDHLQEGVNKILAAAERGENLEAGGAGVRLTRLLREIRYSLREAQREARDRIRPQITIQQLRDIERAAQLEEVLVQALQSRFPSPVVIDHTGGAGEMGADIVIRIPDLFDLEEEKLILVQLKDHEGVSDAHGLKQLETAISYYGKGPTPQGRVIEAVYATLADGFTPDTEKRAMSLQKESGVSVRLINGPTLIASIAEGLLEAATRET